MTLLRKILLAGCGVAALVAGAVIYRGNGRIARLETTNAALSQTSRRVLTANQEMDAAAEALKVYLLDVQTRTATPASYDKWSRQQVQIRAQVAALRQKIAGLDALANDPETANPALAGALDPLRTLAGTLEQRWFAYDEQGSGLTPHSRQYAVNTLLPLVTTEIRPAITALRGVHQSEWSDRIAATAAEEAAVRHRRLLAGVSLGLLGCVAAGVLLLPGGKGKSLPRYRPRPPAIPLPVLPAEPAPTPEPEPAPRVMVDYRQLAVSLPAHLQKILLVEESPSLREMLTLLTSTGDNTVVACASGPEALAAVNAIRFDLIVLNQQMAGMSSLEVLTEARQVLPKLKAIFVTDTPDEDTRERLGAHGVAAVFSKRPDPRELRSAISVALTGTAIPFSTVSELDRAEKLAEARAAREQGLSDGLPPVEPAEPVVPAAPPVRPVRRVPAPEPMPEPVVPPAPVEVARVPEPVAPPPPPVESAPPIPAPLPEIVSTTSDAGETTSPPGELRKRVKLKRRVQEEPKDPPAEG
ncbi:MAG: response regulator [Verrucomicrobia bacterium]|nr:response regulator [Verrucomicrobiota bacterium]